MVELIPKMPDQIIPALPKNSIAPETYEAYVEMVILGLRNLAPYKFIKMQNPYLEIEVSKTATTNAITSTAPSKRPDASNPNFLGKQNTHIHTHTYTDIHTHTDIENPCYFIYIKDK